jgi:hypothetical protein
VLEAGPLGGMLLEVFDAFGEGLAAKLSVIVTAVLIRREVQIQADHWKGYRLEGRQPVQVITQRCFDS